MVQEWSLPYHSLKNTNRYGARVGYSDPRSFSSHGAVRLDEKTKKLHIGAKMKYPSDDSKNMAPGGLQSFRPTLLVAVPKIWDILKKGHGCLD